MKTTVGLLTIAFLLHADPVSAEGWGTDFKAAMKASAARSVPILVEFSGSDWCGPCIRMETEIFSTETFKKFAQESLVLFQADFPRRTTLAPEVVRQNQGLAQLYGITGFPTLLLLDAQGKVLHTTGYRGVSAKEFVASLKDVQSKLVSSKDEDGK